ncbi:hypothetical protein C8Q77DRAFT_1155207 [Trametes polyzona]|nr:hypothetical protein C8Q77DRAFT_1155207 [Trametes polyzona]
MDSASTVLSDLPARPIPLRILRARDRNARQPVNKLPVETLTEIFAIAVDRCFPGEAERLLYALYRVCTHWRDVLNNCPLLYRSFQATHIALMKWHLKRSGTLPIDVHVKQPNSDAVDAPREPIVSPLLDHLHRVRTLSYMVPDSSWESAQNLLETLEKLPDRVLSVLELSAEECSQEAPLDPYSCKKTFSGLTSLTLSDVALSVPYPTQGISDPQQQFRFDNLRHLDLSFNKHEAPPPTSAVIIRLLASCPNLYSFSISSDIAVEFRVEENPPTRPSGNLEELYNSKPKLKYSLDRNRGEDKDEDKEGLLGQR